MGSLISGFRTGSWLGKDRIFVYPPIILVLTVAATIYILVVNNGLLPNGAPFGADFVSFWTAAREALAGNAHVPYDRSLFEPVQQALFPESSYFAFFYPPHYLVYMMPLGALPFYPALAMWMAASFTVATWVILRIARRSVSSQVLILVLAFPATFLTISQGQNSFLSAALFAGGLLVLPSRPLLAGVLFGLLTFKPQLGLLIPLALVAGGYWRTIVAAGATLIFLIVASALLLGTDVWLQFWSQSGYAVETMREGFVAWEKMISTYAAFRLAGLPDVIASVLHWGIALIISALVASVWLKRNKAAYETKAALLLTGALIVTPFGLNYDLFLLAPALCFLGLRGLETGFHDYEKSIMAVIYMMPVLLLPAMAIGLSIASIFLVLFFAMLFKRAAFEHANATH